VVTILSEPGGGYGINADFLEDIFITSLSACNLVSNRTTIPRAFSRENSETIVIRIKVRSILNEVEFVYKIANLLFHGLIN
jgi:hypothetical protein